MIKLSPNFVLFWSFTLMIFRYLISSLQQGFIGHLSLWQDNNNKSKNKKKVKQNLSFSL